jgi:transposase
MWSVCRIPSEEQEDIRRIDREEQRLKKERNQHTNRMKSLLALQGLEMQISGKFLEQIEQARLWNGKALPGYLQKELEREYARYELVMEQLKAMQEEKKELRKMVSEEMKKVSSLYQLRGIGEVSSWVLVMEFFGWRKFRNVKEVGGASGLVPCPYNSGDIVRELGITKVGNRRIRSLLIEIAWYWIRYQPQSELSRWFAARFANNGKRMRRVGIVAVARKLLVALWKYLEQGLVPAGARLKV